MGVYDCTLISLTLSFCLTGTSAILGNNTYFISTKKPLQCHEIKSTSARSKTECSLSCKKDLYSCAGYVYNSSHFRCDVCFIYDETTRLVTVETSNTTSSSMPKINMDSGELYKTLNHYNDVIMSPMASQITSLTTVCSTVYSYADLRKHQSSASLAFVRGIHRGPVTTNGQ